MSKVLVATIPNMIEKEDLNPLSEKADIDFLVQDKISETELAEKAKNYDFLMLNFDIIENLSEEFYKLVSNSNLKAISADITGMSWANPKIAKKHQIALMNTPNYCTDSVAEFTMAQILIYAKQIHHSYEDLKNNQTPKPRKGFNLKDKTLGIIGLGNIGTKLAKIAQGFEMDIVAFDKDQKNIPGIQQVSLEELFKKSDIISLHLKTIENVTTNIINQKLFNLTKPSCFLANQADKRLVNFNDLENALKNKQIAGYAGAYDDDTKKLQKYDNVILMPANAWYSDESLNNLKTIWMNNIINYINNNPVNIVIE